jgi:hypothetical protein
MPSPYFLSLPLMIRNISIALLLLLSIGLFAQKPDAAKVQRVLKKPESGTNLLKTQKTDSVLIPRIIKQWNLSPDFTEEVNIPFDTVFSLFNRFKIVDRYSSFNTSLGNYGLPFYQLNFFDRITDPDKFLYDYYYPYMHVPDKALFMNTQVPFTELVWSFAGPTETSEQTFRVKHSQNVNRFLNFGLIYDIVYSLGKYNYQRAEDKAFTLFSSYTGSKYKLYFSAGLNKMLSYENGGIDSKDQLIQLNARDIPVRLGGLDKANSYLHNRNLLIIQRYTLNGNVPGKSDSVSQKRPGFLGLSGTFSHIFIIESNTRTYSDAYPLSGFYDTAHILINRIVTYDSLYSRSIKNTLRFDFTTDESRKFRLGGGVGIRNELFRYSQIVPTHDTTYADTVTWNKSNIIILGRLYNNIGDKFRWLATGELFLTGYRAGDFNLNGEISKSFDFKKGRASWLITGALANRQPSFWYEQWGSNNFEWHNNLNKELRLDMGTSISYPARTFELKFNYAIIDNYTDFGLDAMPSQHTGGLSVVALTLRKGMRAWKFHLDTDVLIQKSSNMDVLDLPVAAIRSAGYFEHLFRFKQTGGKLNTQIGFDVNFNTAYHPYNYMPATGRFYRQEISTGNYPFVNVFLNFKVKRTRAFIMFDHVNAGMMGNNYDMIPLYPMTLRMLRYGLAWTFYN